MKLASNPRISSNQGLHYTLTVKERLQHEGSDDAVPEAVSEDHRVGGGDADMAGREGQDAGRKADATVGVKQDKSTVGRPTVLHPLNR